MLRWRTKPKGKQNIASLEKTFWQLFKKHLPNKCDYQRIETGSTGRGIPDVNLCYNGVEIWVELKIVSGRKVNITAEQCAWHYRRIRAGGRTFIIARDKVDKVRKGKYDKIYVWTGENAVSVQENGIIAENSYIYETPFDWEQIIAKLFM